MRWPILCRDTEHKLNDTSIMEPNVSSSDGKRVCSNNVVFVKNNADAAAAAGTSTTAAGMLSGGSDEQTVVAARAAPGRWRRYVQQDLTLSEVLSRCWYWGRC